MLNFDEKIQPALDKIEEIKHRIQTIESEYIQTISTHAQNSCSFVKQLSKDVIQSIRHPLTPEIQSAIQQASQKHQVNQELITEIIRAESGFNPQAVSKSGAIGLMQLMPQTARQLGTQNPFDPTQNIDSGTRYLKTLLEQYENNLPMALAAYNAGPSVVEKYKGIPPYPETKAYVEKIISRLKD